jgi:5-(carboxyamino)imidazole ribonucleotide mutase
MGSQSDWEVMKACSSLLDELGVPHETRIVSAHRTPERLRTYALTASERGLHVIVAGAGGAAHLPGMLAAYTRLPVVGVPIPTRNIGGLDSLLSIVQMPRGVPVGTMSIGASGAANAALFAAAILGTTDGRVAEALDRWRRAASDAVAERPLDDQ